MTFTVFQRYLETVLPEDSDRTRLLHAAMAQESPESSLFVLRHGFTNLIEVATDTKPGSFLGKQPQAFEVTRDKRVVWEFTDHARFKTVNQIYLLDMPGDLKKNGVLR